MSEATIDSLRLEIDSSSDGASKGLDALSASLNKLNDAIKKVTGDTGKIPAANDRASKSYVNLYAKLKMAKSAITGISRKISSWITSASDYTETMNLFKVSMGQYAEEAYNDAQEIGNAMGIDPAEWMKAQGIFMTLGKGFGVAGDRANVMSQQLTQLGYDLSSFFNISVEDAMTKLQSGISGELEPLRRLGFDLSQAKLEAVALSLGIDKAVSSMTQAEKAELRYYAIMTQVTDAHGDMARTLDAPANQMRVLNAQVTQLGRSLGNFFIPILNKTLPYIIASVKVLREVLDVFMDLLGIELAEVDFDGSSITDATDQIVSDLEDGQEEAKKLKSYMMGFDELNVINPDTGSDVDELLGSGFDFELPTYNIMDGLVASQVDEIVQKMRDWLGITGDIDSWSDLMDTRLGDILITVGAIGVGFAAWKIGKSINTFITKTLPALKKLKLIKGLTIAAGVSLVVTGLVLGADVITDAITDGLKSVDIGELIASSALIIAGGALIGKAFGKAFTGAAVSAIVLGVAGLGVSLYDAIKNELNITNGLTIAFSTALIAAGIGYLVKGALGAAAGAAMGAVIGTALAGAIWITQNVDDTVAKILGIVSAAALALGAILAFTGVNLPLGIGLMAVGAVSMGTQIAMNTNTLSDKVKGVIAVIATAVSAALLTVGAVLAFSGINLPLGLALMAGGAVTMGASIAPNWDKLSDGVKDTISNITAIVGASLLALGAVLALTGANTMLGIGLMATGALSLGTSVALNWDTFPNKMRGTVGKVVEIVGASLLAVGALLALTGAATPLGLGLMAMGATSLGTAIAFNWDSVVDSMRGTFGKIMAIIGSAAIVIGALLLFSGAGFSLGLGLILGGAASLGTAVAFNWNAITDKVKSICKSIKDTVAGMWTKLKDGAKSAWDGIKSVFSSVATFFKNIFTSAWDGVKTVFSVGGKIFDGIKDGIVSAFKFVVNAIIDGINKVVSLPFNGLNGILDTIQDISIVGLKPFDWLTWRAPVPQIPHLAGGGIVSSGQMFVARESGPELVADIGGRTAVMNNDQIVESVSAGVYQAVLAALGSNNDDGGNTNIVINLDGEKIYENQQKIARGRGYNMGMGAFSFG